MSNNVDPDGTANYEPAHLDLCCLQKPIIIACGSERVNIYSCSIYLSVKIRLDMSYESCIIDNPHEKSSIILS